MKKQIKQVFRARKGDQTCWSKGLYHAEIDLTRFMRVPTFSLQPGDVINMSHAVEPPIPMASMLDVVDPVWLYSN